MSRQGLLESGCVNRIILFLALAAASAWSQQVYPYGDAVVSESIAVTADASEFYFVSNLPLAGQAGSSLLYIYRNNNAGVALLQAIPDSAVVTLPLSTLPAGPNIEELVVSAD